MPVKRCSQCGRFMKLTDEQPHWFSDEFDYDLAIKCGFTEYDNERDEQWQRFAYILDYWECTTCGTLEEHTHGKRYYFNPDSGWYDGEKPLTPKEQIALENQRQEAAGQLRLFD